MNKSEFIEAIYKNGDYETKADASRAYDSVLQTMVNRLTKGTQKDRVLRLPELGTFKLKTRKARKGRNPQTGETIKIGSKKVVSFKTGKNLSDNL